MNFGSNLSMKIDFRFGKKKKNIIQWATFGVILTSLVAFLSHCTGLKEESIWDLLDEIQREFIKDKNNDLNEYIIKTPELLDRRVKRDVDRAINDVIPEYDRIISDYNQKFKQKYIEEKNDDSVCYTDECKALAPPMRLCSPVVIGINCNKNEDK
jgi:hypothetical protein